jgi:hypothetical protein
MSLKPGRHVRRRTEEVPATPPGGSARRSRKVATMSARVFALTISFRSMTEHVASSEKIGARRAAIAACFRRASALWSAMGQKGGSEPHAAAKVR